MHSARLLFNFSEISSRYVFLLLPLDLLPLMYPERIVSSKSHFLITCPKNLNSLVSISLSIIRLFWVLLKTNSLVLCAVYDMRSIFLRYHISTLSRSLFDSRLSVQVSHAYKSTGQKYWLCYERPKISEGFCLINLFFIQIY